MAPAGSSATALGVGFRPATLPERTTLDVAAYGDADTDGIRDGREEGVPGARMAIYTYTTGEWYALYAGADGTVSKADLILRTFFFAAADPLPAVYTRATSPTINDEEGNLPAMGQIIADDPAPCSMHTMQVGLVPAP